MPISRRGERPSPPAEHKPWFVAGGWYYVITVLSAGLLAWVPFVHAISRLGRRPEYVRRATLFGAAALVITLLLAIAPTDAQGNAVGRDGELLSALGGTLALVVIVLGCLQSAKLRREVYRGPVQRTGTQLGELPDPAVAEVLAARDRRQQARKLADADPLMARELRIGRPDLPRTYDDGGLVELNHAPASAIAEVCGIDPAIADNIVAAREARGGFLTVDDVFTAADIPITLWDIIRDRAIVIRP